MMWAVSRSRLWAAVLLVVVTSGCAVTSVRQHPDFANAARKVQKVAVLPADVEYMLLVLTGENERLPEEESKVSSNLAHSMPGILEKRGYVPREFSNERLQRVGKDANFTLQQVKTAYNEVSKQLYERGLVEEEEARKFRVSVGPVVNLLGEALDADALLLVRYAGFKKSEGLIAKEVVSGALLGALTGVVVIPASAGASMEMALLDAHSGDVLWANRGVANAVALLDKLPLTGEAAIAQAKADAAAAEKEKAAASSTSSN